MNPYLDKGNNPHVEVKVFLSKWTLIDCYLDTGFSGGISLPNKYRNLFLSRKPLSFQYAPTPLFQSYLKKETRVYISYRSTIIKWKRNIKFGLKRQKKNL